MTRPSTLSVGETIRLACDWTIVGRLGRGGFGEVYAAVDESGRLAALKVVTRLASMERESPLARRVEAVDGALGIIDHGQRGRQRVLVTPRASRSLADALLADAGLSAPAAVRGTMRAIAAILTALAELDPPLVHRDVTPENLLEVDGAWQLADFGIAGDHGERPEADPFLDARTPEYTAPERWSLQPSTTATDVYALGVIGYRMLSGHLPFTGRRLGRQHLAHVPRPLASADPALDALIHECLAKEPSGRPPARKIAAWLQASG